MKCFFFSKMTDMRIEIMDLHGEYCICCATEIISECFSCTFRYSGIFYHHVISHNRNLLYVVYLSIRILYIYSPSLSPFFSLSQNFNTLSTMQNSQFLVFHFDPSSWFSISKAWLPFYLCLYFSLSLWLSLFPPFYLFAATRQFVV